MAKSSYTRTLFNPSSSPGWPSGPLLQPKLKPNWRQTGQLGLKLGSIGLKRGQNGQVSLIWAHFAFFLASFWPNQPKSTQVALKKKSQTPKQPNKASRIPLFRYFDPIAGLVWPFFSLLWAFWVCRTWDLMHNSPSFQHICAVWHSTDSPDAGGHFGV